MWPDSNPGWKGKPSFLGSGRHTLYYFRAKHVILSSRKSTFKEEKVLQKVKSQSAVTSAYKMVAPALGVFVSLIFL